MKSYVMRYLKGLKEKSNADTFNELNVLQDSRIWVQEIQMLKLLGRQFIICLSPVPGLKFLAKKLCQKQC